MDHLDPFRSRPVQVLPSVAQGGWRLKRYGIVSEGRGIDPAISDAATSEALRRLPEPGALSDGAGNHGVGFQLVHFAQVAVVSPVFYWQWGSVLANLEQLRASWDQPTRFETGVREVVGCIWEMEIVAYEVDLWKRVMLVEGDQPDARLAKYLDTTLP